MANILGTEKLFYKAFCFDMPANALALHKYGKSRRLAVRYGNTISSLAKSETIVLSCQEKHICQAQICASIKMIMTKK